MNAFWKIATSEENIGEFFKFSDCGVVDKSKKNRSPLLESAIEATKESTRTGELIEQVKARASEKTARPQEKNQYDQDKGVYIDQIK